jgi:hypothetical protein
MHSHRLLTAAPLLALAGCAEMGEVMNTALAAALVAPAFTENFEAPVSSSYSVFRAGQSFSTQRNTWQVTSGSIDVVNATVRKEVVAAEGTQVVDLAGSPGAGEISTSFPTTPGQRYTLSFSYARNNNIGGQPALARVEAIGTGALLSADLKHAAPQPFSALQRFSMPFVADSSSTTLRFTSLVGGNAGVTVDAISVTSAAGAATRNLSGEYAYLGQGTCSVTQSGANVRMLCTWAPAGTGPHYEIRGTLAGDTISGQWYSHYAKQGWFRYVGRVLPDGSIEQSQSDDPIRSNMKTAVLTRRP